MFGNSALILIGLCIFLPWVHAAEVPLHWQNGRVSIEDEHVVVTIQHDDGQVDRLPIENIKLVKNIPILPKTMSASTRGDRGVESRETFTWDLIYQPLSDPAKPEAKPEAVQFLKLYGESLQKALRACTAATLVMPNGQRAVQILSSHKHHGPVVAVWIQLENSTTKGTYHAAQCESLDLLASTPAGFTSIALLPYAHSEGPRVEVFAINAPFGVLYHFDAVPGEKADRTDYLYSFSGGPVTLTLPANVDRKKTVKGDYSFSLDREKKQFRIVSKDKTFDSLIQLGSNGNAQLENASAPTDLKNPEWLAEFSSIKRHLRGNSIAEKTKLTAGFYESLGKWLFEVQSPEVIAMSKKRYNAAVLTISAPVTEELPRLKNDVLESVLEKTPADVPHLYLRLEPETTGTEIMMSLYRANFLHDDKSTYEQGYIVIDLASNKTELIVRNIDTILHSLNAIRAVKKLHLIFVTARKNSNLVFEKVKREIDAKAVVTDIDSILTNEQRYSVLASQLKLEPENVAALVKEVQIATQEQKEPINIFGNLESAVTILQPFIQQVENKVPRDSAEFPRRLARALLSTLGYNTLPHFTEAQKIAVSKMDKVLIASGTLFAREDQLEFIKKRFLGYMGRGYKRRRPLTLTLMGDSGTGKSLSIASIASYLNAAVEEVNFAQLKQVKEPPRRHRGSDSILSDLFEWDEWVPLKPEPVPLETKDVLEVLSQRAIQLQSDHRSHKMLVIEEAHARPDVLRQLLPAFGEDDSGVSSVNLEGIEVVLLMNINLKSEHYKALSQLSPDDADYRTLVTSLFEDSINDVPKEMQIDEKIIHALSGRLMHGMVLYPPSGKEFEAQSALIGRVVGKLEKEEGIRLIVPKEAYETLANKALESAKKANFRGMDTALENTLDEIVGGYHARHPGTKNQLEGRFLISVRAKRNTKTQTETKEPYMELLDDSEFGAKLDVKDRFQRFSDTMVAALKHAVEAHQESALVARSKRDITTAKVEEERAESMSMILSSFMRAMSKTFYFNELAPAEREHLQLPQLERPVKKATVLRYTPVICYPECVNDSDKISLDAAVERPIVEMFERFLDETSDSDLHDRVKFRQQLGKMGGVASYTLGLLTRIDRKVDEKAIGNSKFRRWVMAVNELDQFDQRTENAKKLFRLQKDFIDHHWNEWQQLKEKVSKMHQIERDEAMFEFASDVANDLHALKAKDPSFENGSADLKQFVSALKSQKERDAETVVKRLEKQSIERNGAPMAGAACETLLNLPRHSLERASGWLLAETARKAAEIRLSNLFSESASAESESGNHHHDGSIQRENLSEESREIFDVQQRLLRETDGLF